MIKFSVLIPVYNVSKYLEQCMDSIVNQTYANLEIICVNDGSTDDSGEILDAYATMDKRIKVIHKENTGYGHSVNVAIAQASGDYIGIVESDDYIALEMYEKMAKVIEHEDSVLDVVKACYYHVSRTTCEKQNLFDKFKCNKVISPKSYIDLFWVTSSVWSAVYRRDFLLDNDIYFLETPGASYQDTAFVYKIWAMAENIFLMEDALLYYRVDNINSSVKAKGKIWCIRDEICEIERYIEGREEHKSFLERAKWICVYKAYKWNYFRLHFLFRGIFWEEFVWRLKKLQRSECFRPEYWPKECWEEMNYILENPDRYFWDSNENSVKALERFELDLYTKKSEVYAEGVLTYLRNQESIIIYGAGVYGKKVLRYLCNVGLQGRIKCFAVTEAANDQEVEGIAVKDILQLWQEKEGSLVIVAVKETKQDEILTLLKDVGFEKVLRVDEAFISLMK